MNLRPPSFRLVLALAGACIVLWGAKHGGVLSVGNQIFGFFEQNRNIAWAAVAGSVAVAGTAWMRPAWPARAAWLAAVFALSWWCWELSKIASMAFAYLEQGNRQLSEMGMAPIRLKAGIEPGAIAILAGLVIQGVGLCLKHRGAMERQT
jgi:hypothetical protein